MVFEMQVPLLTWLGASCVVSADLILQSPRHIDLPHTSPSVKWILLSLLFSYDLFRIKVTNHKAMWILKDATWWGLWKYTNRLDESAEIDLAPWLIIYLKLNPSISSLHNLRALNWRLPMDLACSLNVGPPFFALPGFLWVLWWTAKVIAYQ